MNSANPPPTRDFLYPLNIYAWVLERFEQECKYLHFGIFNKNNETIGEAQRRSTDLLGRWCVQRRSSDAPGRREIRRPQLRRGAGQKARGDGFDGDLSGPRPWYAR